MIENLNEIFFLKIHMILILYKFWLLNWYLTLLYTGVDKSKLWVHKSLSLYYLLVGVFHMNNYNLFAHPCTFNQPACNQFWYDFEAVQGDVLASKELSTLISDFSQMPEKQNQKVEQEFYESQELWGLVCSFCKPVECLSILPLT